MVNSLDELAQALARNRSAGIVTDLPLSLLQSEEAAKAVQSAALAAFDTDFRGYALVGTHATVRRSLGLREAIVSPIPNRACFESRKTFPLPRGMIGAQCELLFTIGRNYPAAGETVDRQSAADAIVACRPAIGLVGRRTRTAPANPLVATADFACHVATICGPSPRPINWLDLDKLPMTARIDGNLVMSASASDILGHPLEAVAWLALNLVDDGGGLNAGDLVATGSCAPLLQVIPGQTLAVDFDTLGAVNCAFE